MNLNIQVPSKGPQICQIAFIGEAPGAVEAQRREPFVGPAGKSLNELVAGAGIIRHQCYIDNVVQRRPYKDSIRELVDISKKNIIATDEWIAWVDHLRNRLTHVSANVIVAVGNHALFALTGKKGITKWRGSILESTLLPGRKVIPIIHPSAAFHQYIFRRYISLDLKRIVEESLTPEIELPFRDIRIRPSFSELMQYFEVLNASDIIAYDIEVINQELSCIAFSDSPQFGICVPFRSGGTDYFSPPDESIVMTCIAKLLSNPKITKVAQNAIFDSSFLFRKYGIVTNNIQDTMIAQGVLAPDFPKGLDFITSIYTREPYYKDEGKQYMKMMGSEDDFFIYNAKDAIVTLEAWYRLEQDLKRQGNWETYLRQKAIIGPLSYMIERGQLVNVDGLRKAGEKEGYKIEKLTKQLHELCGYEINPKSPDQLKEYFYVKRGLKPYLNRKTGQITTDEKALKRIAIKGYEEARVILGIRKSAKLKGTYFDVGLDSDSRIRCSYNPVGTETGRLSSSANIFGTGSNLQNQPSATKEFFLADPGYLLYNIDLSQAENRITAYIAPEPTMIKNFESGIDTHAFTASMIFKYGIEEITRMDKEDVKCELGNGEQTHRFWGKKSNHSFDYGEGYKTFSFQTEIPEREGLMIRNRWHEIYPGIQRYWDWVDNQIRKDRTMTNLFGRKRTYLDRFGDDMFKQAYALIPQSTVADKINQHGLLYIYNNPVRFKPVELLGQVHDSIILQMPIDIGLGKHLDILRWIVDSLQTPLEWRGSSFVIPVSVKVGRNLKDMKDIDPHELTEIEYKRLCHII